MLLYLFLSLVQGFFRRTYSSLALTHFSQHCCAAIFYMSCHGFHGTFCHNSSPGDPGAFDAPASRWARTFFHCIFIDQSLYSAEIRTVIFEYLYVPLPDCWPWERPVQSTLNWDLYHFSVICSGVHRPCISFLTVDTPSVALSAASDSD